MLFKLIKITETPIDGKVGFLSEFALDLSKDENQIYRAAVLQIVTNSRPENFVINRTYELNLEVSKKKKVGSDGS